ncbi:rha-1 [Symbiodinium sp. CCMP2456]|nr:rha-1 [Symbiodinium sp. CCMP2456]
MAGEVPGEQLLIGRRFMDQLRAPARGSGRAASIMAGPRGKTIGEEEEATVTATALQEGHPADGAGFNMILDDDDFDLEEEFDDFEDDEAVGA